MALDLNLLKTFIAIVDHGSFLAAAQAVARSPSAISVQMKRLEDQVGKPLLLRDARHTKLTPDGQKLLPHARRMVAAEAALFADFKPDVISGTVRLGVPDDVVERFPMQVLRRFTDDHPSVSLMVSVDMTQALIPKVDEGKLDLAIITYAESIPGVSGCEKVWTEPEVWAANKTGIAAEQRPIPLTLWEEGWAWYDPTIKILDEAGVDYTVVLKCENITARRSAILADLAVGPLPLSELGDEIIEAPGLQHIRGLPDYGLGLKIPPISNAASQAAAQHLRDYFAGLRSPGY